MDWGVSVGVCCTALLLTSTGCGSPAGDDSPAPVSDGPTTVAEPTIDSTTSPTVTRPVSREIRELVHQFRSFVLHPSAQTAQALPVSRAGVRLGLGPELRKTVPRSQISSPDVWKIHSNAFRGHNGTFSALLSIRRHVLGDEIPKEIRRSGKIGISVGPHSHCASPPVPAPTGLRHLQRVSIQPGKHAITTCLAWFTVDLFLDGDGQIVAVTLDLWDP